VRDFRTVVRPAAGYVTTSHAKIAESRTVGPKPIGDDGVRQVSLPFQQPAQEFEGRLPVTPWLNDDVKNFALVVDGTPEVVDLAADPDEDLVQMPASRRPWPALSNPSGIDAAELERLPAHRLVGGVDATLGEQVLDIAIAQGEPKVEPNRMLDDRGRKPVTGVGWAAHDAAYPAMFLTATSLRDSARWTRPSRGMPRLGRTAPHATEFPDVRF